MGPSKIAVAWLVMSSTLFIAAGAIAQSGAPPAPVLLAPGDPGSGGGGSGGTPTSFPNSSNTGVPSGVSLAPCSRDLSTDGATYDRCLFASGIALNANNVTITRSKIVGDITGDYKPRNLSLTDVEIDGENAQTDAFNGTFGYTCLRCKVHNVAKCFSGQGFRVEDSYCYDLYGWGDSHNEPVLGSGTSPLILRRNNLVANWNGSTSGGGMSSVVSFYSHGQSWGPVDNIIVEGNRFESRSGAAVCVYAGNTTDYHPTNVRFVDNVWAGGPSGGCGSPVIGWQRGAGNVWTNNRYDSGELIPEPATNTYN